MKYPDLQKIEHEICEIARSIVKDTRVVKDNCGRCISCLVAQARTERDRNIHGLAFDSSEDVAMIGAKETLLKEKMFEGWKNN